MLISHPKRLGENGDFLKSVLNTLIKELGWHVTTKISLELSSGYISATPGTKKNKESQHIFSNIRSFLPGKEGDEEGDISF